MKRILLYWLPFLIFCFSISACRKSEFLKARPDNSITVPSTLEDLQAILDEDNMMNGAGGFGIVPAFGEIGADNYYMTDNGFASDISPLYRNCYTWAKQLYANEKILDWSFPYRAILYSNVALEGIGQIHPNAEQQTLWNNIKGSALFYRAHMFYQLAQVFAPPYDKKRASTDPGIPLRLIADINEKVGRATVQETYNRILEDLHNAIPLLPIVPLKKTRPSKPAVYALLARVYQTMEDYDQSLLYADSCLMLSSSLINYNLVDQNTQFSSPFPRFNEEVIFNCTIQGADITPLNLGNGFGDTTLYNSYEENDLRKPIFFKNFYGLGLGFFGTYDGEFSFFAGLANDEVYLIKSECLARKGKATEAMNTLNILLRNRYETSTFTDLTASNAHDALKIILQHRRKELVFRGLRWTDLRRLNKDPEFAVTLTRTVNGQKYTLPPNDPRYVYPIPDEVIGFNPGMPQNQR